MFTLPWKFMGRLSQTTIRTTVTELRPSQFHRPVALSYAQPLQSPNCRVGGWRRSRWSQRKDAREAPGCSSAWEIVLRAADLLDVFC